MSIGVVLHCVLKGLKHQRIVVAVTNHVTDDSAVIEVQNGAKIYLVYLNALIPFEFRYVGKPFFIRFIRIELSVEQILGYVLWALCLPGAAAVAVLDRGTDVSDPADAEHSLVIDIDAVVMTQVVIEPSVTLIRTFLMDLLNRICETFILRSPLTQLAGGPFVIGRTRHMEQRAGRLDGIACFFVCFPDRTINAALSHFRKASLLSISSNFLAGHAPFPPDTACA